MSSKSKRQRTTIYSSDQSNPTQESDVSSLEFDLEEIRKTLPSNKILKEDRSDDSAPVDLREEDDISRNNYLQQIFGKAKNLEGSNDYDRSELDRYLTDRLGPTEKGMDALQWWGQLGSRYPILSHMARDILAIPLSTFASQSTFSAGGRHLDAFRSSLTLKMVQALVCTQDWLRANGSIGIDVEENLRDLEELKKDFGDDDMDDKVVYVDTTI